VKADGKTWLFTVAGQHDRSGGGVRVAVVALPPVPQAQSDELLAAIAILWPGDTVGVHTHPGPEAWYVLAGEQCLETAVGVSRARAGQTMVAPAATPMKLVITGSSLRRAFFIVLHDAAQPWISDATWQPQGRCNPH
jgi:quercetin dioxygenase-like cupin family protein